MFKFTTTTIINSNVDPTTGKNRFEVVANPDSETEENMLQLKRLLNIKAEEVTNGQWTVYKKESTPAVAAQVKVDLGDLTISADSVYRLALYVKLSGSQSSYYANDLAFKGKPFYVEASGAANAAALAAAFVANAKKYMQMVYEYEAVSISVDEDDDATLVITATDEYQRFTKVAIQTYPTVAPSCACCAPFEVSNFVDVITKEDNAVTVVAEGAEGFGTYVHLMKDFRVPTAANTRWNRIAIDEAPIPGAVYDQYVLYFCKDRGILGTDAVGDMVTSKTCHVLWVNQSVVSDFETALEGVGIELAAASAAGYTKEFVPATLAERVAALETAE